MRRRGEAAAKSATASNIRADISFASLISIQVTSLRSSLFRLLRFAHLFQVTSLRSSLQLTAVKTNRLAKSYDDTRMTASSKRPGRKAYLLITLFALLMGLDRKS